MGKITNQGVPTVGGITAKELAKHNTPEDAWLSYRGKVYDISGWHEHPGGRVIFTHAGRDATDTFGAFHPASANDMLAKFYIGDLADSTTAHQLTFEDECRKIKELVYRNGWHKASPLYYVFKVSSNIALWAGAVAILAYSTSPLAILASATLLALFWQQDGWLAHDFCHHQVFKNRAYGDWAGLIIGNVWQGFSVEWWKDKHNTHHAIPNMHESAENRHDGDPDIDTVPLLAWSRHMARMCIKAGPIGQWFVKHQAVMYFPILLVARMSWLLQSFTYVFRFKSPWEQERLHEQPLRLGYREHVGLILYYAWYFGIMIKFLSPLQSLAYLLLSQMICGLFLALAFGVGHNGMACYDADKCPAFGEWQITTTRNVHGFFLVGWFLGGLHHQVEHHLFPFVPRHNLGKLRALVEPLCKKYNIPYHSTTLWDGTVEVVKHLDCVTQELLREFPGL